MNYLREQWEKLRRYLACRDWYRKTMTDERHSCEETRLAIAELVERIAYTRAHLLHALQYFGEHEPDLAAMLQVKLVEVSDCLDAARKHAEALRFNDAVYQSGRGRYLADLLLAEVERYWALVVIAADPRHAELLWFKVGHAEIFEQRKRLLYFLHYSVVLERMM